MIPKYMEVYNSIKDKIQAEVYQLNDMLPTGEQLSKEYGCSVLTVKKALDKLVGEGFIVRKRGLGTLVKRNTGNHLDMSAMGGNMQIARREIVRNMTSIVLVFDIIKSDEDMAEKLNIETGDFIYYIERVRLIDNEARIVEYTWMPINVIKGLQMKHVEESIYYYITKELNLNIQSAHVAIHAVRPNEIEKEYFHMDDTDFVAEMVQTAYLDNSEIFEYSISRSIPKYFEFETTIIQELY